MTKLSEFLGQVTEKFRGCGIVSAAADAELLVAHHLGVSRGQLQALALAGEEFDPTQKLLGDIALRIERIPLQHLTGLAPFRNLELQVGPGVFIPRPETESVVDIGLSKIAGITNPRVLDIGTGSGAIAISMATESDAIVTAIEASNLAHDYAERNVERYAPAIRLLLGDFREIAFQFEHFDLVISNPPYIPLSAIPIDPEVREHDPELALYGGEDGLDLIREIIETAKYLLVPGGSLVLEHADGQSDAVCELLLGQWREVSAHQDPTGRYRSVSARK